MSSFSFYTLLEKKLLLGLNLHCISLSFQYHPYSFNESALVALVSELFTHCHLASVLLLY